MAETAQPGTAQSAGAPTVTTQTVTQTVPASTDVATGGAGEVSTAQRDPALRPLDPRPLRHVHHGQTGAMWVSVTLVFVGFLVGGIGMLLGPSWPLFVIGAVICVLGIAAGLIMQALGFGLYEKKK